MPFQDLLPPACPDHAGGFDSKAAIYSAGGTDALLLAFAHHFVPHYAAHEDWQLRRVMFIVEKSLANPQPSRLAPTARLAADARPYRDFARACVAAWRLEAAAAVPVPCGGEEQAAAMVADLRRVGQLRRCCDE